MNIVSEFVEVLTQQVMSLLSLLYLPPSILVCHKFTKKVK